MISYGKQTIDQDDIDAVADVLGSDMLTQGACVPEFEKQLSQYVESKYAVAANSGTSALHIACMALGLGAGDRLWTSAITFVASANCGLYCDALIDFVDVNPRDGNLSLDDLKVKLKSAEIKGELPKVLVVVHFAGQSCEMEDISVLAKRYNFSVIEDASHALGGEYKGKKIGSCEYSNVTTFSFHPVKSMTTGEGGMAVTNCEQIASKMRLLASHGISRSQSDNSSLNQLPWGYEQQLLGFNYRLSDIHAALGLSQLKKLDEFISKRNELASWYDAELKGPLIKPLVQSPDRINAYHLYVVLLDLKISKEQAFRELRENGVGVHVHYIPVYKQPYFQSLSFAEDYCPNAEVYYRKAITLPLFPSLTREQQRFIVDTLTTVVE